MRNREPWFPSQFILSPEGPYEDEFGVRHSPAHGRDRCLARRDGREGPRPGHHHRQGHRRGGQAAWRRPGGAPGDRLLRGEHGGERHLYHRRRGGTGEGAIRDPGRPVPRQGAGNQAHHAESGQPGGQLYAQGRPGPAIKLRGATSIAGSQNPLIIIDGTISRATLADIASEDIERIEVIKGAAASSLYGSDAANGVIQIFTKRGKNLADGKLLVTARNEVGASFVSRRIPVSLSNPYLTHTDANGVTSFVDGNGPFIDPLTPPPILKPDRIADQPYPSYHDFQAEALHPGVFYTNYASIGQRRGSTNFNGSFENTRTEGAIFGLKGFTRQNFRLNVDQQLTPRVDLEISSFYGRSDNHPLSDPGSPTSGTQQAGQLGPFFAITFLPPYFDLFGTNPDGTPFTAKMPPGWTNVSNPLYSLANVQRDQVRSRFTGGGKVRWRMLDWLTGEANYNFDQEGDDYNQLVPFGFLNSAGAPTPGSLFKRQFTGRTYNTGATLTAINRWHGITNTTNASFVYEDQTSSNTSLSAGALTL